MNDIDQGGFYTFDDKIYLTLDRRMVSEPPASKLPAGRLPLFLREEV